MKNKVYNIVREQWFPWILCIGLTVGFILLFSHTTSPSSWYYNGKSSTIAVTIARGWHFGIVPYKDLYGTDGPWGYFLGSIGVGLAYGNKSGCIIPQLINMFLFLLSVYYISRLVSKNIFYNCTTLFLTVIFLSQSYPDGMYEEEFLLPWIGWTYYLVFSYIRNRNKHHFIFSFFYGLSIGVSILSSLKGLNALCIPIIITWILLLKDKQYQSFIQNIFAFIIGCACIVLPFFIYFYKQGCFSDFIHAVYVYDDRERITTVLSSYYYKKMFFIRFTAISLFFTSILSFIDHHITEAILCLLTGILELIYFLRINLVDVYSLYCVINIVLLSNSVIEVFTLDKHIKINTVVSSITSIICILYFAFTKYSSVISYSYNYTIYHNQGWEGLVENIPSEDYDSVVFYGNSAMQNAYALTNAMPCYKYFYDQDAMANKDETIKEDIIDTFKNGTAKWILTNHSISTIEEILDERYTLVEKTNTYNLYQLNS